MSSPKDDSIPTLPMPTKLGLEVYAVEHPTIERAFGVRVILPEGRTFDDYKGDVRVSPIEHAISMALVGIGLEKKCVEVTDFDGSFSKTHDINTAQLVEAMMMESVAEGYRKEFNDLKNEGVLPDHVTFEEFLAVELAGTPAKGVH